MRNKISLVLAGLLGSGLLLADEAATQAPSEAKKTLSGFFDGMEAKGFGFARYTTIDGAGKLGSDQQYRMKLDLTSGKIDGWSFTGGIMFNYGASAITTDNNSNGATQGSMAVVTGKGYNDRFGIATFSVNKEIATEATKTEFNVGRINIDSVFSNNTTDIGTGGKVRLKTNSGITYGADFLGSWVTSHVIYNMRDAAFGFEGNPANPNPANGSLGNDLIMLSIKGKQVADSGLDFNVAVGHANRILDYLAFADVKYDFGGFYILGQVSAAGMSSNPNFMTSSGATYVGNWIPGGNSQLANSAYTGFSNNDWAKNRGLYNIQIGYKSKEAPVAAKLGFLGSFGDGYGTLLDHKGGIDVAGKFWVDNYDSTNEGFGFLGAGARSGTSIMVAYLGLDFKLSQSWKFGLDYSFITGDNNYPFIANAVAGSLIEKIGGRGVTFHEIAPSLTYKPIKNVTAAVMYGRNLGDVNYGKARFEVRYDF